MIELGLAHYIYKLLPKSKLWAYCLCVIISAVVIRICNAHTLTLTLWQLCMHD